MMEELEQKSNDMLNKLYELRRESYELIKELKDRKKFYNKG
jgi:hypothetical protein